MESKVRKRIEDIGDEHEICCCISIGDRLDSDV
jgi:hypothetical protein